MYRSTRESRYFTELRNWLSRRPDGIAVLRGSEAYPSIHGTVLFYQTEEGVVVAADVEGLPDPSGSCAQPIFGFHLHEGGACTGNESDPFADAASHYNPDGCPHPHHAGDFPPLLGNDGHALSVFMTNRFTVREILGKTVIVHASPDDFSTQPAGNAGTKIACGVVGTR